MVSDAGIKNLRWHDLRHDFASNLVMKEVSLYAVQKLLGHKKIDQTMKYAHLAPDFIAESVRRLD
ncbi:tyrosine-type recombinase/integrase [Candidiatus Paracoxiella cheracis]|uniref:tyrosine-type recombinase/integrase n=1 Tax=Candidiatus Paracoxiella cheracis TaxID=3405120 RepID=UPI003BF60562